MPIATKGSQFDISAENNTAKLAKKFTKYLKKGDVVFLYGEIGVGKTTFVRHLINNFQNNNNLLLSEVPSPTFNILNEYEIKDLIIQHYDLFRLKNADETKNIGLLENKTEVITLVEWPEKIENKQEKIIELRFEYDENLNKRFLTIGGLKEKELNELR
jgi:tRNA threonylcarbamoyladenosine biosynthesis protein TsaE